MATCPVCVCVCVLVHAYASLSEKHEGEKQAQIVFSHLPISQPHGKKQNDYI